ncbi:FtsX-like permease family protein [Roseospira marina]|uniref:FtsX-like permease family protein n=1 Tax=Roseospira marina TaxID=140057 RepID=A0A5M6IEN5_9PROT|nr:FtsX-like permease family protein [Roseospira marina]KAA5606437.1 FtsX-like permease family protein [Roseospira marina]MBB4314148.1 putative ABC transport system permease protein [Roseospira marina]MBB5087309.1 putative ABC transport system permease protein [Roseospira marina]
MEDLWYQLPPLAQDALLLVGLLLPVLLIAAIVLRGYAPGPLIGALLRRFRWANLVFVLLIALSVGMSIGLIAQERGLRIGMAQAADKFDLVVAAPGSEMTMLLAAVFLQPSDVPLLSGATYTAIATHENVEIAAPLAFGDSYKGSSVVGTIADFATYLSDDRITGHLWTDPFEAVAGAAAPVALGDTFTPAHGHGAAAEQGAHEGVRFTVVGKMARTGTPWDTAILIPIEAVWMVHGLANGHPLSAGDQIGPPFDPDLFPGTPAIVVHTSALWANYALKSEFSRDNETMAFFPGTVLANLYRIMGDVRQAMSVMSGLTQVLVAASVLLGLSILTRLFQRQTAMLRALGAPRRFVIAVIWSYGVTLLAAGTALGLGLGLGAATLLSWLVTHRTDVLVQASLGWNEVHLAAAFLAITSLLSLLPALVLLRQPITNGLRA